MLELIDCEKISKQIDEKEIEATIEAMLFAYGEKLTLIRISEILGINKNILKPIIDDMILRYKNSLRGIMIREISDGYQLCSKPEYHKYIKNLFEQKQKQSLSSAALEALAIIAYNQPITRTKIESIRGVDSDSAVSKLLERNLIKEAGRLETPGKSIVYETTEEFLRCFGFKSCSELPQI